jgi:hypothetical protein
MMELEDNGSIPFLDVLINMREDGNLGHPVYRKETTHKTIFTQAHIITPPKR